MSNPNPEEKNQTVPFYPDHIRIEFYVVLGILALVLVAGFLGMLHPVGLQEPADSLNTPAHVKPEWYFLGLYQLLKYVPPSIIGIDGPMFAIVTIVLVVLVMLIWPFLDNKQNSKRAIRLRWIFSIIGIVAMVILTIWGEVS